jgi:hypothetical protein
MLDAGNLSASLLERTRQITISKDLIEFMVLEEKD